MEAMSDLHALLKQSVEEHGALSAGQARAAVMEMLEGEASDLEIASLLTAISVRGAAAEELTGFVEAMRAMCLPVPLTDEERNQVVDTCGTGGDYRGTFNISTGAALVAAAAGAKVAKHGNHAMSSKCGSADVLEALGVPVELEPEKAAECLRTTGFMFLYAPCMHPAMKRVQHVRKALGFRTIFNLAGPLTNPAGARMQVMGVFAANLVEVVSEAMVKLDVRHAMVVHGADGRGADSLDELTLEGESLVAEVRGHTVRLFRMDAGAAGLSQAPLSAIAGGDARQNATILEQILEGVPGPRRDVVLLNAAAALIVAGLAPDFPEGVRLAAAAVDSGAAFRLLERLREFKEQVSGVRDQGSVHQQRP
jgi:anthranilate phosphoribosyltransferase